MAFTSHVKFFRLFKTPRTCLSTVLCHDHINFDSIQIVSIVVNLVKIN